MPTESSPDSEVATFKSVSKMCQEERRAFASREGNSGGADFEDTAEDPLAWVYVPDMRVDVLRRLVWPEFADEKLQGVFRALRASYDRRSADRPDGPKSFDQMIAWWSLREHGYPLVFSRQKAGDLYPWDGVHRLYHFYLTKARATVPALIGVPAGDAPEYTPKVTVRGTTVFLRRRHYGNDRPALQGVCDDGPFATFTVNLPDAPMGEDEVAIKNWSECEGFLDVLEDQGVVRRTGRTIRSGYVEAPTALLLV